MNYAELIEVVNKYWSDKSRSPEQTKEDLEALKEDIDLLIEALG